MNEYVITCQLKDDKGAVTYGNLFKDLSLDGIVPSLCPTDSNKALFFQSLEALVVLWKNSGRYWIDKYDIKKVFVRIANTNFQVMELSLNPDRTKLSWLPESETFYISVLYTDGIKPAWKFLGDDEYWFKVCNDTSDDEVYEFMSAAKAREFFYKYRDQIKHYFGRRILEVKIVEDTKFNSVERLGY